MIALNVSAIKETIADKYDDIEAILANAGDTPSEDELATIDQLNAEIGKDGDEPTGLYAQLKKAQSLEETKKRIAANRSRERGGPDRIEPVDTKPDPKGGFNHFGEFCRAVLNAVPGDHYAGVDDRLLRLNAPGATTSAQEGVGADGGYAVPPDFRAQLVSLIDSEDSLLGLTDRQQTMSNAISYPVSETTPWGSTGVQAYRRAELAQMTQTKPALKELEVKVPELYALVPVTNELLEDAPAMGSFVTSEATRALDFKCNLEIVQGTGAGQMLGLLNAGSTISVAKEGSQVADTIVGLNILKMYARMPQRSRANAVWLAHQDTEVQLQTLMKIGRLDTGGTDTGWGTMLPQFTYDPDGNPRLMGKRVIYTEACETVGDNGDIILWDPTRYLTVTKTNSAVADTSIHLWFDYATTAFRFMFRIGGQPWLSAAYSPRDGSNTYSHCVTLAARA